MESLNVRAKDDHVFRQARDVLERGMEEWREEWALEWAKTILELLKANSYLRETVVSQDSDITELRQAPWWPGGD